MRTYFFAAVLLGAFLCSIMTSRADAPPEPRSCAETGDCLHAYEARGRQLWAKRCFPEYQREIETSAVWLDETNTPRAAYPTFANGDDHSEGFALRWYAPTHPGAACESPSDYRLSGFLFRERSTRPRFDPTS